MKTPLASCMFAVICLLGLFAYGECCASSVRQFFLGKGKEVLKVEYKGCFPGEVHFTTTQYDNMKLSMCNTPCYNGGFIYMALMGKYCLCETKIKNDEKADDSNCQTPCPGNTKEKCGGKNFYSIYTTAKEYTEPV